MTKIQIAALSAEISKCKSADEIRKSTNRFLNTNNIDDKYSRALQRSLMKISDTNKALQKVFDFLLNNEFPTKMHDTGVCRYKGSAIGGMECHSPRL